MEGNEDVDRTSPVSCGVSCDGTWQRRRHSSLNGCVTVITLIDIEALSALCKECSDYEKCDKKSVDYLKWNYRVLLLATIQKQFIDKSRVSLAKYKSTSRN